MKKIICFVVSLICVVSVCATSVAAEFHCVKDKTKYSYTKELSGVGFGRARGSKSEVFTEAYVSSSSNKYVETYVKRYNDFTNTLQQSAHKSGAFNKNNSIVNSQCSIVRLYNIDYISNCHTVMIYSKATKQNAGVLLSYNVIAQEYD